MRSCHDGAGASVEKAADYDCNRIFQRVDSREMNNFPGLLAGDMVVNVKPGGGERCGIRRSAAHRLRKWMDAA
jgi:hypothetical protein